MNSPLPVELQRRWGHLPDLKQRGGNEWSSSCPQCGGGGNRRDLSDRFRMFGGDNTSNARGFCRQCNYFSWADEDLPGERPSREQIEATTKERLRLLEIEHQRIKDKLQRVADSDFWRRWHDNMEPSHRQMWERQGIEPYFIDYYSLGYCADHETYYNGQEWHSPSMTIPHYGAGWTLTNIQHRLLNPPEPGDKYRQMAGIPAAMFLTEPEEKLSGPVLVVEGAKKGIVTYTNLGTESGLVVAIPSKTPSPDMLEKLIDCEPIYLALDPDAYFQTITKDGRKIPPMVNRIGAKLDGRAIAVKLPVKPDDFFFIHGGKPVDMMAYIKQGKRIKA